MFTLTRQTNVLSRRQAILGYQDSPVSSSKSTQQPAHKTTGKGRRSFTAVLLKALAAFAV